MQILFINPNLRPGHPTRYLPVGLGYVMTAVRDAGHSVELLDIGLLDSSDLEVEAFLAQNRWDAVLSGSIVTHYKWMKWLTEAIDRNAPRAFIAIGNSVAGSVPQLFLEHSKADAIIVGEGEVTCTEMLTALENGRPLAEVPGLVFRDESGKAVSTDRRRAGPIDSFAPPDWSLFDLEGYFEATDSASAWGVRADGKIWRTMPVATARGCVFKCTFCHIVYKHDPYRHRSPDAVIDEIQHHVETHGANYINFWDDLSFYKLDQAEKFVDSLLEADLDIAWSAAVRTDLFGQTQIPYERRLEVARKFRRAGCLTLGYSLESGSAAILEMMNKRVQVEFFEEQIRVLNEAGITSNTSIVVGYPIETRETLRETFDLCERNRIYPSVGFLLPLPDTEMYDYAKERGFITDEDAYLDSITERQDVCLNMTSLTDEEIMQEINRGCERLNQALSLGLTEERFIRTGGYRKHTEEKSKPRRNTGDTSFNYSGQFFGPGAPTNDA